MRIAFYYGSLGQEDLELSETNPYGPLLVGALRRQGATVAYERRLDEVFIRTHAGDVDVLHLHWPHHDYADRDRLKMAKAMRQLVGRLHLAKSLGYRIVWTAHNVYPHDSPDRGIDHEFRVELCRLADAVIAHCEEAAAAIRSTFGRAGRVHVIPHGHFIGTHPETLTRTEAREALAIPVNARVFGVVGAIDPYKGLERLIDAIAGLRSEPWLVIAGQCDPEYAGVLERRLRLQLGVRGLFRPFVGFAPGSEITRVLAAADIFPFAFQAITTSGSVILAQSWGRAVVVPDVGCIGRTVPTGAGFAYDPGRTGALDEALMAVLDLDPKQARIAALNHMKTLDWDAIAVATLRAYGDKP